MRSSTLMTKSKNVLKKFAALALTVATVFSAVPAQASAAEVLSVSDIFVSETDYANTMESVVEPYLDQYKQSGYITEKAGGFLLLFLC